MAPVFAHTISRAYRLKVSREQPAESWKSRCWPRIPFLAAFLGQAIQLRLPAVFPCRITRPHPPPASPGGAFRPCLPAPSPGHIFRLCLPAVASDDRSRDVNRQIHAPWACVWRPSGWNCHRRLRFYSHSVNWHNRGQKKRTFYLKTMSILNGFQNLTNLDHPEVVSNDMSIIQYPLFAKKSCFTTWPWVPFPSVCQLSATLLSSL